MSRAAPVKKAAKIPVTAMAEQSRDPFHPELKEENFFSMFVNLATKVSSIEGIVIELRDLVKGKPPEYRGYEDRLFDAEQILCSFVDERNAERSAKEKKDTEALQTKIAWRLFWRDLLAKDIFAKIILVIVTSLVSLYFAGVKLF